MSDPQNHVPGGPGPALHPQAHVPGGPGPVLHPHASGNVPCDKICAVLPCIVDTINSLSYALNKAIDACHPWDGKGGCDCDDKGNAVTPPLAQPQLP